MTELDSPKCDVCHVTMEIGFVVDHGYGVSYPAAWVAGVPRWHWWTGLKLRRDQKLPVTTYRCPQCGRLASFARAGRWPA